MSICKAVGLLVFLTALSGCGGGGGGGGGGTATTSSLVQSSTVVVSSASLSDAISSSSTSSVKLEFTKKSSVEIFVGDSVANPVVGADSLGGVIYRSTEPDVVLVDSVSGVVQAKAAGKAEIFAELKSNPSVSVSYWVTVAERTIDFTSLVGGDENSVYLSSGGIGVRLSRVCDMRDCPGRDLGVYTGKQLLDASESMLTDYLFEFAGQSLQVDVNRPGFPKLFHHESLVFKNELWVFGGQSGSSISNTILVSNDGINWNSKSLVAAFPGRQEHQIAEFNQKLWLIGGYGYAEKSSVFSSVLNDVWVSEDGVAWQKILASGPFEPRRNHKVISFAEKLWLFGGENSKGQPLSDVWSSMDGVTWTLVSPNLLGTNLRRVDVAVYLNKLWLANSGKIWNSDDGVSWVDISSSVPYSAGDALFVHNGKLWIGSDYAVSFWNTSDGVSWGKTAGPLVNQMADHEVLSFKSKIFVLGGYDPSDSSRVLVSEDGIRWENPLPRKFTARYGHSVAQYKDSLFMVGGLADNGSLNDVWKSADGLVWSEVLSSAPFSKRSDLNLVEWDNKLYVIGGGINDIWSTGNGSHWVLETEKAEFPAGVTFELVSYAGQLWLFGSDNSVWVSGDAKSWSKKGVISSFPERIGYKVIAYKEKLWFIGGLQISDRIMKNDVWTSSDGVSWTQLEVKQSFQPVAWHEATVFNNKMFLSGGSLDSGQSSLTYVSDDGVNWQINSSLPTQSSDHASIAFKDRLIITGGLRSFIGPMDDVLVSDGFSGWKTAFTQKIHFND